MTHKYVALLRGINVGGKNKVSMAELKGYLKKLGYKNVLTYIASGNALFESDKSAEEISNQIEEILPIKFKLDSSIIKVLVLSHEQLREVINQAPRGFGTQPDKYHSDVIFLIGISTDEAMKVFTPHPEVDKIWAGDRAIYSQRLSAQRTKSRLGKIVGTVPYQNMTIRSWNTATKLLALLGD